MLDGEQQPVVGTAHQVAGGVGPGMQIGGEVALVPWIGQGEISWLSALTHVTIPAQRGAAPPRTCANDLSGPRSMTGVYSWSP